MATASVSNLQCKPVDTLHSTPYTTHGLSFSNVRRCAHRQWSTIYRSTITPRLTAVSTMKGTRVAEAVRITSWTLGRARNSQSLMMSAASTNPPTISELAEKSISPATAPRNVWTASSVESSVRNRNSTRKGTLSWNTCARKRISSTSSATNMSTQLKLISSSETTCHLRNVVTVTSPATSGAAGTACSGPEGDACGAEMFKTLPGWSRGVASFIWAGDAGDAGSEGPVCGVSPPPGTGNDIAAGETCCCTDGSVCWVASAGSGTKEKEKAELTASRRQPGVNASLRASWKPRGLSSPGVGIKLPKRRRAGCVIILGLGITSCKLPIVSGRSGITGCCSVVNGH
mmetsp:Transcript_27125/g.62521  ORF Transcript_27125/g.62521 Transcript_27125/m.62521 type:complete len:344 (-) Transcript_27125:80-1111(-)